MWPTSGSVGYDRMDATLVKRLVESSRFSCSRQENRMMGKIGDSGRRQVWKGHQQRAGLLPQGSTSNTLSSVQHQDRWIQLPHEEHCRKP